jgi:hypothetical protein
MKDHKNAGKTEDYGVCGSRGRDKNICDSVINSDDIMKRFSCEK